MSANVNNKAMQDELIRTVAILFGLALSLLLAPIMIFSLLFSYLVWASYYEREERKWIRSLAIALVGFLVTASAWTTAKVFAPQVLSLVMSKRTINILLSSKILQNAHYSYFAILVFGFYLFNTKLKPNLKAYEELRRVVKKNFLPVAVLLQAGHAFFTMILSIFGVSLDSRNSLLSGLLSGLVLIFSTYILFIIGIFPFIQTRLFDLAIGIVGGYICLFWYDAITEKFCGIQGVGNGLKKTDDGILVGRLIAPKRMDLNLSWKDLNHHIHILGQPGAGKSVLLRNLYAHQILCGDSLIMVDLKADISVREDFRSLCYQAARTDDLITIDLSHPEESHGYNPLLFGNATELKDKIIGSIEWSEPYYKKVSERVLLTVLIGLVWLRDNKGLVPTLEDLLIAISSVRGLTVLNEQIEDEKIKAVMNELCASSGKDLFKDLESLRAELTLLVRSEFGSIFVKHNSLNIIEAIKTKKVILVNLDGQTYSESAKKFGRLLLGDLRAASGAIVTNLHQDERPRFTVIVDEFSDIVSTEDMANTFVGFLNRCRGSGIGVVIAHQSLGDFKDETIKSQIMDSTETLFSFVQKDPKTCDTLAAIVGTQLEMQHTDQTTETLLMKVPTGMGTRRETQGYIYHPNTFKNLNTGEAVYMAKKPTRHGILKVKMIDVPKVEFPNSESLPVSSKGERAVLGLGERLLIRESEFSRGLIGPLPPTKELEI